MGSVLDAVAAEWDRQDDRLPPLRDYRYLKNLLDDARAALDHFEANLAARRLRESAEAARRTGVLEAGIAAARRSARGVSEIDVRRDLASAEIRAREARSYLGRMDFPTALRKAAEGEDRVASANRRTGEVRSHFTSADNLAAWKRRVAAGIAASRGGRTSLVVLKAKHRLDVYQDGRKLRSFPVELGGRPILPKLREGDRATPEGSYQVVEKLGKGRTVYTLALKLNYPNAEDRARFEDLRRRGALPPTARIGGLIEIHGKGGRGFDWTLGCVALRDADMAWLFDRVPRGCPVVIVGSDGSEPGETAPERSAAKKRSVK
ncbi:MAG: L,D-transpeptidase [Acidobacteria bacterium]|nr:L,D-transpeptidase [Acidobacteriota bacterium]